MKRLLQPISLAGSQLGAVRHVCAFFANDEEEYRVLLPFLREGLSCGDKALHVINPEARQEHLQRLAEAGIDSTTNQQSGQLQIRINTEFYLREGRFDQDRMLAAFEEMAASARSAEGFPMSRIVCRMDWASGDRSRIQDVIEFESASMCAFRFKIRALALLLKLPAKCSNRSTPQSRMVWASGSLLVVRLLKQITEGCGRQRTTGQEPPLHSHFLASTGPTLRRNHERSISIGLLGHKWGSGSPSAIQLLRPIAAASGH